MADEIYKVKREVMAEMAKGFYHDYMPIIQQVKSDVSALHTDKQDKETLDRINEQLSKAESLLQQLMTISVKNPETDMTEVALNAIKYGTFKNNPALREGRIIVKIDENYTYVQSSTDGKIDLFDENGVKVKEIDIKELEK